MLNGLVVGHGLFKDFECAIQKVRSSAGSVVSKHVHNEYEYTIILEGRGVFITETVRVPFVAYDYFVVKPAQIHAMEFETNTRYLAITIPASKGYPDGPS